MIFSRQPSRPLARFLVFACLCLAGQAQGDTVYKSIAPDGRVVYSDQPPSGGKITKVYSFESLPASPVPEAVLRYRRELEKSAKQRLAEKAPAGATQLFAADWCGYCRKAKAYLAEKGVPYQEINIDTEAGAAAYAQAGGGSGIPLLLWHGQRVQGFSTAAYDALFAHGR